MRPVPAADGVTGDGHRPPAHRAGPPPDSPAGGVLLVGRQIRVLHWSGAGRSGLLGQGLPAVGRVGDEELPGASVGGVVARLLERGERLVLDLLGAHPSPRRQPWRRLRRRRQVQGVLAGQVERVVGQLVFVQQDCRSDLVARVAAGQGRQLAQRLAQAIGELHRSHGSAAWAEGLHDHSGHPRDLPHGVGKGLAFRPRVGGAQARGHQPGLPRCGTAGRIGQLNHQDPPPRERLWRRQGTSGTRRSPGRRVRAGWRRCHPHATRRPCC